MKLSDFMVLDAIVPELESSLRDDAIRELVSSLSKSGQVKANKVDEITQQIIDRENQGSTGIGKGIAVPHVKHPSVKKIVGTIGCSHAGLDFSSLDKSPVYSVLLLISPPDDPDRHLQAMENIFSHLQKELFRKFLRQAEDQETIIELIKEADEARQDSHI